MHVLYLTDRLSIRGGADLHLLQLVGWARGRGYRVTIAAGRIEDDVGLPHGVDVARIRGLGSAVESESRLGDLDQRLRGADLVHVQNVMNPTVLRRATATGRAVVTIQDHRVFCPGMGKTMPDGVVCRAPMDRSICRTCLTDSDYLDRLMRLTTARRDALDGAQLVVLSRWMADELTKVRLTGAQVIPPWVSVDSAEPSRRDGFLMGGRLVEHKGLMDGWEAWRRADTGQPLVVVGEGPISGRFDGAHCTGWLASDLLRPRLRSSIALLIPALWQEPFGMLGVEALAEGTPVVVADSGGTADWSHAGCIRVPRGDVGEMAQAIRWLAENDTMARRLGREGRSMVARRFSRASIEQKLEALYGSVVAG